MKRSRRRKLSVLMPEQERARSLREWSRVSHTVLSPLSCLRPGLSIRLLLSLLLVVTRLISGKCGFGFRKQLVCPRPSDQACALPTPKFISFPPFSCSWPPFSHIPSCTHTLCFSAPAPLPLPGVSLLHFHEDLQTSYPHSGSFSNAASPCSHFDTALYSTNMWSIRGSSNCAAVQKDEPGLLRGEPRVAWVGGEEIKLRLQGRSLPGLRR